MDSGLKRISSRRTFFMKKVFPVVWLGVPVALLAIWLTHPRTVPPDVLVVPIVMITFGLLIMRKLVWDLMDAVYDGGDHLLVRNRGEEDRIPLADIMNVSATAFQNPPRVTLRLTRPSAFGEEISFIPAVGPWHWPFSRIKVADDLIARVYEARKGR